MSIPVVVGTKKTIEECGYSEKWLEDQIANNPAILGLGEGLKVVYRQREQASGGRLDLLLEDIGSDEGPMFEVELMLGKTDASHIIRTIEYWDNEKRKWPKRAHTAVIVAESITNRFFNVIRLLGDAIPIIAIQANLIEADGKCILHFSTVLDTYTEPEQGTDGTGPADEAYWVQNAPGTLKMAKMLQELFSPEGDQSVLHVTQSYISLMVGESDWVWLHARANDRSRVNFYLVEPFLSEAISCLKESGIEWKKRDNYHGGTAVYFTMDTADVERNIKCLTTLYRLGKKSVDPESQPGEKE